MNHDWKRVRMDVDGPVAHVRMKGLACTGRAFCGAEAQQIGVVTRAFEDEGTMMQWAIAIARDGAARSPPTEVQGFRGQSVHDRIGETPYSSPPHVATLPSGRSRAIEDAPGRGG